MEMWERTHDSRDSQLLSQILQEGSFYRSCMHLWPDAAEWNAQLAKIYSLQLASHRQRPDWIEARGQAHIRHGNALLRNGDHSSALHSYEQAKQDLLDSWQIVADERRSMKTLRSSRQMWAWQNFDREMCTLAKSISNPQSINFVR